MGVTKNALLRYNTLDRCFRNPGRKYYIDNLVDACNKALYEFDPKSKGVKKRSVYDDIRFMESSQGWSIPMDRIKDGRKVYFRYEDLSFSISNQPINELEADQIKSAMLVLSRFKGMPQFGWVNELLPKLDQSFNLSESNQEIISFDSNEFLAGAEFIDPLFNAILYFKALKVSYKPFNSDSEQLLVFHPYYLKQYNNRWFLIGKNTDYDNLTNLALDRIKSIHDSNEKYIPNDTIDFEEYFDDFIGVSKTEGAGLEEIVLKAYNRAPNYIKTKPLHGSQKKIEETDSNYTFSLNVIPNYELESLILQFGDNIEVLSPSSFRERIKVRIKKLNSLYNSAG